MQCAVGMYTSVVSRWQSVTVCSLSLHLTAVRVVVITGLACLDGQPGNAAFPPQEKRPYALPITVCSLILHLAAVRVVVIIYWGCLPRGQPGNAAFPSQGKRPFASPSIYLNSAPARYLALVTPARSVELLLPPPHRLPCSASYNILCTCNPV